MSQLSLTSDASLLVRDDQGRYLPATADQILEAARLVIDQKNPRGALFTSPALVRDYLWPASSTKSSRRCSSTHSIG